MTMIKSKALEANLASTYVDVTIDARYECIQAVMSRYFGLMEGVNTFLRELSHPYRNWQFIVSEARTYALDYFHLFQSHPRGVEAAEAMVGIFSEVIEADVDDGVRTDAVDNLLLYLQQIIGDSRDRLPEFLPVLNTAFSGIHDCPDDRFFLFVKSFYPIKRIVRLLGDRCEGCVTDYTIFNRLLIRTFKATYRFWCEVKDPWESFQASAGKIRIRSTYAPVLRTSPMNCCTPWKTGCADRKPAAGGNPGGVRSTAYAYRFQCNRRALPENAPDAHGGGCRYRPGEPVEGHFLFHIMSISSLNLIHEEALRDINRTVGWLIENESYRNIGDLIEKTFFILKTQTEQFPATTLTCVLNMGQAVYQTDEIDLVNFFIDRVVDLGFQTPMLGGVGNDWQIQVNSAHLQNIRTWLELIECKPKWSSRLLSSLIIKLSLSGIFIKDTDLFPRDITRLSQQ
jgi:pyruvate,orthophosphate dikinase